MKLKAFDKFENTTEALAAATALLDGKISKGVLSHAWLAWLLNPASSSQPRRQQTWLHMPAAGLKKFLKKNVDGETMAVADSKLGSIVKEKLGIPCIYK